MSDIEVDLLRKTYNLPTEPSLDRGRFRLVKRLILFVLIFGATTGLLFSHQIKGGNELNSFPRLSLVSTISQLVQSGDRTLKGEEEERVNMLLMGVGGAGHDGPQLSDTMMFASIKPETGEVALLSIPRDLIVQIPGYGWRKVNHANAFGEQQEAGYGPQLASEVIEEVLAQPIHYYARVDFSGFAELIDIVGELDVYVERTFTDAQYPSHGKAYADCGTSQTQFNEAGEPIEVPTYACRFETITFEKGWTKMNGDTALKYVRSRHGNNGESSDFARSRRQAQVIKAVKEQVLSASTFLSPTKLSKIYETLDENIATNLSTWELLRFVSLAKDLDTENITHHVLDASAESPLYQTNLGGAYVLLPKNDDWGQVRALAANLFAKTPEVGTTPSTHTARVPRIEIQNGTSIPGLAFRTSQILTTHGYQVTSVSNAQSKGFKNTVVYDLTQGRKSSDLAALKDLLKADVTLSATGWLLSNDVIPKELSLAGETLEALATESDIDFLVILGEKSASVAQNYRP